MDIERERRLFDLVRRTLVLPASERDGFVESTCAGDEDLARRVRELVAEDATAPLEEQGRPGRPEFLPGQVFRGYEIVRRLGAGGMGIVYEARQPTLRRSVALKMIRAPETATPTDMARFRQEAEAAARLNHPYIVEVHEAGESEGIPYFTMQLVEGARPLSSALKHGPMDRAAAVTLVSQIARAVGYAHQRGVIHRDLKPLNILLDRQDQPNIVDFGLAKLFGNTLSGGESIRSLSDDGKLLGTPRYLSPEQVRGEDLTTSTDIHSLGVILYELLTGSPPFDAPSVGEILRQIAFTAPEPLSSGGTRLPRDLQVICRKCLRKDPGDRYRTADALADDLDRWLNDEPIEARPGSRVERMLRWARRHPGITGLAVVAAVSATLAISTLYWAWRTAAERIEDGVRVPLALATAERAGRKAGRSWRALEQLDQATRNLHLVDESVSGPLRRELQDEAIACLSLIDLRPARGPGETWVGDPHEQGLVRLASDFDRYAHALSDGSIVLRARPSNDIILRLGGLAGAPPCRSLRFSRTELHLASVHEAARGRFVLELWDLEQQRSVLSSPIAGPDAFDFSADGRSIVFARGGKLVVAPMDGGDEREQPAPFGVRAIRVDPVRGLMAVLPEKGGGVSLFDLAGDAAPVALETPPVNSAAWNPRGRWLALGCRDGQMIVWDTEAERADVRAQRTIGSEQGVAIDDVAWHPRGVLVAGCTSRDQVHLWHVAKGELEVSGTGLRMGAPQFSADGGRLGPVLDGVRSSLLEIAEGRLVSHARGHPGRVHGAGWRSIGPGRMGRVFATAADDGVRLWNRAGFELAFLPEEGARVALFTETDLVVVGASGVSLRSVTGGGRLPTSSSLHLGAPVRLDEGIACHGGDYHAELGLLVVAADEQVRIHDLRTGTLRTAFAVPPRTTFVDLSADGRWLATGTDGGEDVMIWDPDSGSLARELPVGGSAAVCFYEDQLSGRSWLVTSSGDAYTFWDVATWEPEKIIPARLGRSHGSLVFSPRLPLFAVSEAGWFKVYSLQGFQELLSPEFTSQDPVIFSPNGFVLVTADTKNHLYLWDLRVLRSLLGELDLDLRLPPLPEVEETPLIRSVVLDS